MRFYSLQNSVALGTALLGLAASPTQAQISSYEVIQPSSLEIVDPAQTTFEAITPAIINLQVTEPFSITATAPVPDGFSDPPGTRHIGYVSHNNTEVTHGNALLINETSSVDIGVRMRVARPYPYWPGNYTYRVLLTITPQ